MKKLISIVIAVALVVPVAPVLYVLVGGGIVGGAACTILGVITVLAVQRLINGAMEGYQWYKARNVKVTDPSPLSAPEYTTYESDWTKITKDDRI